MNPQKFEGVSSSADGSNELTPERRAEINSRLAEIEQEISDSLDKIGENQRLYDAGQLSDKEKNLGADAALYTIAAREQERDSLLAELDGVTAPKPAKRILRALGSAVGFLFRRRGPGPQ